MRKILSVLRRGQTDLLAYKIRRLFKGKNALRPCPVTLYIEASNVCTLRCAACPTGVGKLNRPPRSMKLEEAKKIINEVRGYTYAINFWHLGEPFLNRDLLSMVRHSTAMGIRANVATNGMHLSDMDVCREIVLSGVHHLLVSLDGADQETLARYRVNADFEKVVQGIQMVRRARKELKSDRPRIEVSMLLMKHNLDQRQRVRDIAKSAGADSFTERPIGIFEPEENTFQELACQLVPEDASVARYVRDETGKYVVLGDAESACDRLDSSMVILSDGRVVPCCFDFLTENCMGNVFEEGVKGVWQGRRYKEFRSRVKSQRRTVRMCTRCKDVEGTFTAYFDLSGAGIAAAEAP